MVCNKGTGVFIIGAVHSCEIINTSLYVGMHAFVQALLPGWSSLMLHACAIFLWEEKLSYTCVYVIYTDLYILLPLIRSLPPSLSSHI